VRIFRGAVPGLIASLLLVSCASQQSQTLRSPSGKFVVSYDGGGAEMDASYYFSGPGDKAGFSISSGADTPFDRSRFLWSPSEKTLLVLQNEGKTYEQFVLIRLDQGEGAVDEEGNRFSVIGIRPFEELYFGGSSVTVNSVSDSDVTFLFNEGRIMRIALKDLRAESLRQEGLPVR